MAIPRRPAVPAPTSVRYQELDWLRVLAILGVLFHHSAALFIADSAYAWNQEPSAFLDELRDRTDYLRMPLLFFVAGAACALAAARKGTSEFLQDRLRKLAIPLLFAVATYAPLVRWVRHEIGNELHARGLAAAPAAPWTLWSWGIYWFLAYLLPMVVVGTLALRALRRRPEVERWIAARADGGGLILAAGAMATLLVALVPTRVAELWPWPDLVMVKPFLGYTTFFVLGLTYGRFPAVRRALGEQRRIAVVIWLSLATLDFVVPSPTPRSASAYAMVLTDALTAWVWVAAAIGYAQRYLVRMPPLGSRIAEVSYAMYLTHQPWILLGGLLVASLPLPLPIKLAVVLAIVYCGTFAVSRALRRTALGCLLFGLQPPRPARATAAPTDPGGGVVLPPGPLPGVPQTSTHAGAVARERHTAQ